MSSRIVVSVVALIGLGILFAPRSPSVTRVDPARLLDRVFARCVQWGKQDKDQVTKIGGLVRRNYTPLVEGEEEMRGTKCWVLRLKPRVKRRPWRQLWVSQDDAAILAVREWSHDNRIRQTRLRDEGLAELGRDVDTNDLQDLRDLPVPGFIPSGFELARGVDWRAASMKQLVYTDGLFNISLFYTFSYEREGEQRHRPTVVDCGGVLAARTVLRDCEITCVADLPDDVLMHITQSIPR